MNEFDFDFDGGWGTDKDGHLLPTLPGEAEQMAESRVAENKIESLKHTEEGQIRTPNPHINPLNVPSIHKQNMRAVATPRYTTIHHRNPPSYVNLINPGLLSLSRRELENREKVYDTYDFDRERRLRDLWTPWISIEHELYNRKMIETEIEDLVQREIQRNVYGVGISNIKLIKLIKDVIRKNDNKYLKNPTKPRKPQKKKKSKKSKKKPAKKKKSKKKPAKKKKSKKKP
jgi:hypothetical protein